MPVTLKVVFLMVATTAFYTYVGQIVPQKEVHPPKEVELAGDLTTEDLVPIGKQLFEDKGMCTTCHTIGKSGALRFPDLDGIATRAATRVPGLSALDYMGQSLYQPDAFIVDGFAPGMPQINKSPVGLTGEEIRCVLAFLQSLGGTPTITLETSIPFSPEAAAGGSGAATRSASAAGDGPAALVASFGCTECHSVSDPAGIEFSSFVDVGARLSRDEIEAAVTSHASLGGNDRLVELGYYDAVTLAQVRLMVDHLSSLEGPG